MDGSSWKTTEDFYDAFLGAVGAPSWHGRNFNALRDSIITGNINEVGLAAPASFEFRGNELDVPVREKWRGRVASSVIENGFVYLPATADWLAPYLHELTTFPNGKHDDQADSTSQALDWFKQGHTGPGMGSTTSCARNTKP